ncbi:hypothetical protein TBLA_0B05450 [Henningerozyma blattae CBS 6284]|uniref:t-SNARE coiled-coil homology domain-containing protein n=1 Tax=Henningerozyma blattae (strain ATCC 34711 / CBS 6284 / DSM 70876 / NBRC 10599 / NRRL Y-10934 / UCD 77-7) TaxID=1071380 RepID=I2GZ22_HENB6|nr:hypothetical protein TBLA_0B05450 [Tetrapisispora blattae CBS 6284]CCH59374.1 hypothetical protein TBLA_0B05450 [Tetrapisispora blattae CBS 6284]
MSSAKYTQIESRNDQKLDSLANKLATFRNINQEINSQATQDNSMIDQLSNSFDSLFNNLKNTSHRLTRSMQSGKGIWKMTGLALLLFFILYHLLKLF